MKAFPQIFESGVLPKEETGMDLRDYFAAKALPYLMKDVKEDLNLDGAWEGWDLSEIAIEMMAESSYVIADAMMKARQQ